MSPVRKRIRMKPQPYSGVWSFDYVTKGFVTVPPWGKKGSGGKPCSAWLALDHWKNPVGVMATKKGFVPDWDKEKKVWYWLRKPLPKAVKYNWKGYDL